jgi:hypothetical protein
MTKDKAIQAQSLRAELAALRAEIIQLQQELADTHALALETMRMVQEAEAATQPTPTKIRARTSRPARKK